MLRLRGTSPSNHVEGPCLPLYMGTGTSPPQPQYTVNVGRSHPDLIIMRCKACGSCGQSGGRKE
jgi:hypothetical protein